MSRSLALAWCPNADAVGPAIAEWRAARGPLQVLAFVAEGDPGRVAAVQAACRGLDQPVAGAVFPQLVVGDAFRRDGVVLVGLPGAPPPLLLRRVGDPAAVESAAEAVAAHVEAHLGEDDEATLFCLFDALVPNIATHLDAWYLRLADRVRYAGVNAGSETFAPMPCLFDAREVIGDGALLQLLPGHPGAVLEHGYGVPEHLVTATSADHNRVVQLDWQPALAGYRARMRERFGVEVDAVNFYQHAVHFPFGIVRADGEVLVRIPVGLGADESIACVGEIPPHAVLALLDAAASSREAPARLAERLGPGVAGDDLLLFYCAGRRLHSGEAATDELREVARATGARTAVGALSLGEIGGARAGGYPLFHNATLVGMPCR